LRRETKNVPAVLEELDGRKEELRRALVKVEQSQHGSKGEHAQKRKKRRTSTTGYDEPGRLKRKKS
jgi:hypothetical protein